MNQDVRTPDVQYSLCTVAGKGLSMMILFPPQNNQFITTHKYSSASVYRGICDLTTVCAATRC